MTKAVSEQAGQVREWTIYRFAVPKRIAERVVGPHTPKDGCEVIEAAPVRELVEADRRAIGALCQLAEERQNADDDLAEHLWGIAHALELGVAPFTPDPNPPEGSDG